MPLSEPAPPSPYSKAKLGMCRRAHEFSGLTDLDLDFALFDQVFKFLEGPEPGLRFQGLPQSDLFEQRSGENSRRRSGRGIDVPDRFRCQKREFERVERTDIGL